MSMATLEELRINFTHANDESSGRHSWISQSGAHDYINGKDQYLGRWDPILCDPPSSAG